MGIRFLLAMPLKKLQTIIRKKFTLMLKQEKLLKQYRLYIMQMLQEPPLPCMQERNLLLAMSMRDCIS